MKIFQNCPEISKTYQLFKSVCSFNELNFQGKTQSVSEVLPRSNPAEIQFPISKRSETNKVPLTSK